MSSKEEQQQDWQERAEWLVRMRQRQEEINRFSLNTQEIQREIIEGIKAQRTQRRNYLRLKRSYTESDLDRDPQLQRMEQELNKFTRQAEMEQRHMEEAELQIKRLEESWAESAPGPELDL